MAITPDTPNAAQDVPIPMETSPVQNPRSSIVGMDLGGELTLVGERVEPLRIVEPVPVADLPRTEETTVNFPPEGTPTVASEKGSSSAAKPRGKRTKATTDGPRRASRRLAANKGSPSVQPFKKRRTAFVNLSDEEDETAPASPTVDAAPKSVDSGNSGSEFDDTESDKDFTTTDNDAGDESSDGDSLASDETLGEWAKKKGKKPRSAPTSKPTAGETSRRSKGKEPLDVESDSEIEAYDGCNPLFYTVEAEQRWKTMGSRLCLPERKIDRSSFDKYNMTPFLLQCGMMPTVSYAAPFVADAVKLVYAHISKKFGSLDSKQYGRVFVRGRVYDITPAKINLLLDMDEADDDDEVLDYMDEVVQHITGGRVSTWSSNVKVSDLTSLHNVFHKLTISNWLPSSNSTAVTDNQVVLIYKLSCGMKIDFGQMVFNRIRQAAKSSSGILPYPSLIYKLICAQGFIKGKSDHLQATGIFKITSTYVAGDCVIDLPWVDPRNPQRSAADVEDSVESCVGTLPVPQALLQQELERCDERIRLFSSQLHQAQELRSKLVILLSSQKGGEHNGGGGSGTAGGTGEEEDRGQGAGAGDGDQGDQAGGSEDERAAAFEREVQELYGDIQLEREREERNEEEDPQLNL